MPVNQQPSIYGEMTLRLIDRATGEVVDEYGPSKNKVTDEGVRALWTRASTVDAAKDFTLKTIALGMDFGDTERWSIFNPEPPSRAFTMDDQEVVYTIPTEDIEFTFPTDPAVRIKAVLDGRTLMETNFPTQVDLTFTSATVRFANGIVLSYKRFPIRSISREVDAEIVWTITLQNGEEYCEI